MLLKILLVFALIYESLGLLSVLCAILKSDTKEELAECLNNVDYLKESESWIFYALVSLLNFSVFAYIIVFLISQLPNLFILWVMVLFMEFVYFVFHITSDIMGVGRWSIMTVPRISLMLCEGILSLIGLLIMIIN